MHDLQTIQQMNREATDKAVNMNEEGETMSKFNVGDAVQVFSEYYEGYPKGCVGTVTSVVDPGYLVTDPYGKYPKGLYFHEYELVEIKLPETEPPAEWEKGLLPEGARVINEYSGNLGTIESCDPSDEILPYFVIYDDGDGDWEGPDEIRPAKTEEETFEFKAGDSVRLVGDSWVRYGGAIHKVMAVDPALGRVKLLDPEVSERDPWDDGVWFHLIEGWEIEKVEPEQVQEDYGMKLGDRVFVHQAEHYGHNGTVSMFLPDGVVWVDVANDSRLAVRASEVEVLPTVEELDESGWTFEAVLGILREAFVDTGLKDGVSREVIKDYTEAALQRAQEFFAAQLHKAHTDGYQDGRLELKDKIREVLS